MSIPKISSLLLVLFLSSEGTLGAITITNPFQPIVQPVVDFFKPEASSTKVPIVPTTASSAVVSAPSAASNVAPFEAFISYRRNPSKNLAMLLKVLLERQNVSAYLDVEDLKGGHWDEQLRAAIDESPTFILVLGNGTLDRAKGDSNYTDFMHQEIKQAVDLDKKIVLVMDGFEFPSSMNDYSPEIQEALLNQGLTWEHKLVDQSIDRLITYMRESSPFSSLRKHA